MKRKNSVLYLDSNCLLVINSRGKLRTLYTPFRAKCISPVMGIPANSWVVVDEIIQRGNNFLYLIQGNAIPYKHFKIEIRF